MADSKITALTALTAADPINDMLPIVDVSDTTMAASGTTKKISVNNILGASGTATLASATITGDLTVRTNKLLVTATGVGVGAAPVNPFDVVSTAGTLSVFKRTGSNGAFIGIEDGSGAGLAYLGFTNGTFSIQTPGSGYSDKYTIATDGTATWSVAGTTAMTLNSIGLGVGGIVTGTGPTILVEGTAGTYAKFNSKVGAKTWSAGYRSGTLQYEIQEDATERFVIANGGNVGIGVTPSVKLDVLSAAAEGTIRLTSTIDGSNASPKASSLSLRSGSASVETARIASFNRFANVGGGDLVFSTADTSAVLQTRATIDSSGNLLVGLTVDSYTPSKGVSMFSGNSSRVAVGHANGTLTGDYYHSFAYNSTLIGSISQNGTTGVLYNTSSDYRLKESVKPISGGLARVNALKPSIYNWKSDGSTGEGFLAHELAEVVPFAVSGEKDAVNADGTIKSQGIDMSRIVPILVAAIQELTARVQTLEAR